MAQTQTARSTPGAPTEAATSRLFVLDLSGGRVFSINPDGSGAKTLVTGCRNPDGIAVDAKAGYIYWTNMGVPSRNDGSIERADLDGGNRRIIVPEGGTFTPKQLTLDRTDQKLYWSDREGMRVMRANLDGSDIEVLIQTGDSDDDRRDATRWCVGISVDTAGGHFYWTQKGPDNSERGRIFRAGIDMPQGQTATTRRDITLLFDKLPEPIDLELDVEHRMLYWTDRGDAPKGNTVNRTSIDTTPQQELLLGHLGEGIGIALDIRHDRMFVTELAGTLYSAGLDGSNPRMIAGGQGNLTGIAYTESV
jgi:DNA-binding beta-propeller fold protein YncE